jgi:hypothetical protein
VENNLSDLKWHFEGLEASGALTHKLRKLQLESSSPPRKAKATTKQKSKSKQSKEYSFSFSFFSLNEKSYVTSPVTYHVFQHFYRKNLFLFTIFLAFSDEENKELFLLNIRAR